MSRDEHYDQWGRSLNRNHDTVDCICSDTLGPGAGSIYQGGWLVAGDLARVQASPLRAGLVVNCTDYVFDGEAKQVGCGKQ